MRFFIAVIAQGDEPASADEMTAIDIITGIWVSTCGLTRRRRNKH